MKEPPPPTKVGEITCIRPLSNPSLIETSHWRLSMWWKPRAHCFSTTLQQCVHTLLRISNWIFLWTYTNQFPWIPGSSFMRECSTNCWQGCTLKRNTNLKYANLQGSQFDCNGTCSHHSSLCKRRGVANPTSAATTIETVKECLLKPSFFFSF